MVDTKQIIKLLVETSLPYGEIAKKCNCSYSNVNYWAKRIKKSDLEVQKRSRGKKALSIEEIIK
jgi:transposase